MPESKIYCAGRKSLVVSTPEEIVRQRLFLELTTTLQFPANHIVFEKGVAQMPHLSLSSQKMPKRRVDLICFAKGIHPEHELYPLLIIECKAVKLSPKVISQVVGYNYYIKAPFIAIANQEQIQFGYPDGKSYAFLPYIPPYPELLLSLRTRPLL